MLLPVKACYVPGEHISIEVPAHSSGQLIVEHLGKPVARCDVPADPGSMTPRLVDLPALPEGGYGLSLHSPDGEILATTAVEVLADPASRLRYGFVANFAPDRDLAPVLRNFRRLHLSGALFYDWAYRHANLMGPENYSDPLGQPVSLATVRRLAAALRAGGTLPLGYAAVYGVGKAEWPDWESAALLQADGTICSLGEFLWLVDPSDPAWLAHFRADLRAATDKVGFAGFHLDQYGWPRRADRPDGQEVDMAEAFDVLIREVRAELPDATLVFNNVSDFPVWRTADSPQDVTYTEIWEPHDTLADIAAVATRSRMLAPSRPAVLAAYQTIFEHAPAAVADVTIRLTMATLFSHGATQLLAGEAGNVLIDPYYVRNHAAEPSTLETLARWYDMLVAAGDVLLAPGCADITRSVVGKHNGEVDVHGPVEISHHAVPGVVWRRVVQTPQGAVVHLINLTRQEETGWDTPKVPITPVEGLTLRVRRSGARLPVIRVADPDRGTSFHVVPFTVDGDYLVASLPALNVWQIVLLGNS